MHLSIRKWTPSKAFMSCVFKGRTSALYSRIESIRATYKRDLVFLAIDLLFQILPRDPKVPKAIPIRRLTSGVAEALGLVSVPR